jgi:hypothetical protein
MLCEEQIQTLKNRPSLEPVSVCVNEELGGENEREEHVEFLQLTFEQGRGSVSRPQEFYNLGFDCVHHKVLRIPDQK